MDLSVAVKGGLSGALSKHAERVFRLADGLSNEQFWTKPYPYGNSFGHLVLHLTGNLNHYIGAQIAGTGYVRDREREFTDPSKRPKAEVLSDFGDSIKMVSQTLGAQTAESLTLAPHEMERVDFDTRFGILFHCISHLNHHVGQMIYLEKELRQQAQHQTA